MGTAESIAAPPDPSEYEFWAMGPAVFYHADRIAKEEGKLPPSRFLKRWYEIHDAIENPDGTPGFKIEHPKYWAWMSGLQCPVYMKEVHEDIQTSVRFPREEIVAAFGPHFGGTSSWIFGHALYDHVMVEPIREIETAGVHLSHNQERADEVQGLCYLIGRAAAMGIQVDIPDSILPIRDYGYSYARNWGDLNKYNGLQK